MKKILTMLALLLLATLAMFFFLRARRESSPEQTATSKKVPTNSNVIIPASPSNALPILSNAAPNQAAASLSGDGKDMESIRKWAHNDLEVQRMVEENSRITRRQLIELKETAAAVMERSRSTGEEVKQLTLPNFDGKEILFEIKRADLEPSKQVGTFTGQLPNRPNSTVTLSFKFGREAFTVISPDDGLYLQAWPRDPGQVILTSFDPELYTSMPEGEPIKTTNAFKPFQ